MHTLIKKNVKIVVGSDLMSKFVLEPYSALVCNFLDDLSKNISNSNFDSKFSDIITFGFWCRKANIILFKKNFVDNKKRIGVGNVFHISPSNVPINFAYSLAFGLLSGNSNVIKLPTKKYPQVSVLCKILSKLLKNKKYKLLNKMITIIKYNKINEVTKLYSSFCNARIIWGGDDTINQIREFKISPQSFEITFSDRYSFCIINADKLKKISNSKLNILIRNFFNDTFLVDQNACSSPHLIVWVGDKDEKIKNKFWESLNNLAMKKYNLKNIGSIDKYTQLLKNIIDLKELDFFKLYEKNIHRIVLKKLPKNIDLFRGRWGYFYEYSSEDLNFLKDIVNKRYQTLTYFGFNKKFLRQKILDDKLLGIDRIVPIGRSLDMDPYWDGYDIVKTLSRIINIL